MRRTLMTLALFCTFLPLQSIAQDTDDAINQNYTVICDSDASAQVVETIWSGDGPAAMLELMTQYRRLAIETGKIGCTIRATVGFSNIDGLVMRSISSTQAAGKIYRYDIEIGESLYPLISNLTYRRFGGTVAPG